MYAQDDILIKNDLEHGKCVEWLHESGNETVHNKRLIWNDGGWPGWVFSFLSLPGERLAPVDLDVR